MTGLRVVCLGFEAGGRRPLGLTCGRRLRHGLAVAATPVSLTWTADAHCTDANLSAHPYATALRNEAGGFCS